MFGEIYPKISNKEDIHSSMSDFELICELGHGSFGTVYKVKRKTDGNIYALKKVYLNQLKEKEKDNSLNEIRILASINNKNIIQYKESFFDKINNSLCLVMEYAECGDLEKKITVRQKKNLYFTEYEIINMIIQIIKGLKSLHDSKIMHRDIKSANIFLFNDNIVKIGDLNVSKILKNNLHNTQTGTPYYASPEIWENKSYDFKSDIWSLGCLIYEICALKAPFRGNSMEIVYDKVMKGIYEPIPKIYSKALASIVYMCLQINPINRPNCNQLLNIIVQQISFFNLQGNQIDIFSDEEIDIKKKNLFNFNSSLNYKIDKGLFNQDNNENKKICNGKEINNLLNTIKMPKKLNDINLILPKNRYNSSTTRRNIQSAMNKIRNKLPKINITEQKHLNNINDKENNINSKDIKKKTNIAKLEKKKNLNHNYSETNMINEIPVFKNIEDKYNNMNYNNENILSNKNSELTQDDIKEDINISENTMTNLNQNSIKNNNNNSKVSDSSIKAEQILEEIEKQNKIINQPFEKSNSNNNILNNKIILNKVNNEKKNNQNNHSRIPQKSQSHSRYNLSYLNQLTENNNKDLSLININFNNLSYITNINTNNNPVKINSKKGIDINIKKKFFEQNNLFFNKDNNVSANEKVYIKGDENKYLNLFSPHSKNDNSSEKVSKEINNIDNENKAIQFQRNFQQINNIPNKDKKRAISAFNKRNKHKKEKSFNQLQNNYSFFGSNGNKLEYNNSNNNIINKSNHKTINSNTPNKKELIPNGINFNSFNRKINRNSLNIKKNNYNLYNNNNQYTIDSIKLRTRKNNNSNINVHLPSIDNNNIINKNEIITISPIFETINSNNSKKANNNDNEYIKKNLDSSIEKQLKKPKKLNIIPLTTKIRNNDSIFQNFKKIIPNKNPIRIHPLIQGLDNSINEIIGNKKSNIENIIIPHFNDTELLDNNIKKVIKNYKIIEKIEE